MSPLIFPWIERLDRVAIPGTSLRVRADALLATNRASQYRWQEARALFERAVASARELNDPEALFLTASAALNVWLSPARWEATLEYVRDVSARPREGVSRFTLRLFLESAARMFLAA